MRARQIDERVDDLLRQVPEAHLQFLIGETGEVLMRMIERVFANHRTPSQERRLTGLSLLQGGDGRLDRRCIAVGVLGEERDVLGGRGVALAAHAASALRT